MMNFRYVLLGLIIFMSCARSVEPTVENINTIFKSMDFTFAFYDKDGGVKSFSFVNDVLVYKSDQPTIRREISYAEVLIINDYIQNIVNLHDSSLNPEEQHHYVVENTAYKAIIVPRQEAFYFEELLKTLKLN